MRVKDIQITFFDFLPYECVAAEEYLELMAEKGWLLQSITGPFLKFKRIIPQNIKYSVDVLHKVSVFDRKDSDVALEYREYCQAAGWNYICQKGKIQIFYTECNKETSSIHTDEDEKFKSVLKASLYYVGSQLLLTLLFLFNLYLQLFMGATTDFLLGSNLGLLSIVAVATVIVMNSIEIVSFILWVIKASSKLKENRFMPYNTYQQLRIKNLLKSTFALTIVLFLLKFSLIDKDGSASNMPIVILMIMCIPIIIMVYVQNFINRKRYSKNINRTLIISSVLVSIYLIITLTGGLVFRSVNELEQSNVVPTENVNLTLKDFGYIEKAGTSPYTSFDKSILAERIYYSYNHGDDYLFYTLFKSQYPRVIKFHEDRLLSRLNKYGLDFKQEDTSLPSDIKVYSDSEKGSFVLVSEDRVIDIRKNFSDISDDEFLNKVYETLFN